jgi:spermidine/putrescine transport system ATP-binding protein
MVVSIQSAQTEGLRDHRMAAATASELSPAISLRGVEKRFGATTALQPTDLDVQDGEFLCLLGPSGCGKTTLLNIIGGFLAPSKGSVSMDGTRVDRLPPHQRNVNTVFQSYALFPHMTVGNNVAFGLRMAKTPKREMWARVRETLDLVGLADYESRMPGALSGGQQQRVALARALVRRPRVLALDEPFGALDLNLRQRLQLELKQLHQELGITFLFVTHDQQEAMVMSDRIAVMSEGRIEQLGSPAEIYQQPVNLFVGQFVGDSNILPIQMDSGRAVLTAPASDPDVASPTSSATVEVEPAPPLPRNLLPDSALDGASTLLIRPEMVRIGTDPSGAVPAEVTQVSFLGDSIRVDMRVIGSRQALTAKLTGTGTGSDFASSVPAGRVSVTWKPDDVVVFSSNTSQSSHQSVTRPHNGGHLVRTAH